MTAPRLEATLEAMDVRRRLVDTSTKLSLAAVLGSFRCLLREASGLQLAFQLTSAIRAFELAT